jgi:hypothetical protein
MKWMLLAALMVSVSGQCEDKMSKAISELNKEKAEFIAEKITQERWGHSGKNDEEPKEVKPKKTLKECMKPNNVIDDEVKRCMEGK